ncbi:cupin domain-containing protein [Actinomadura sp. DC4]|uniref:cupin domain-containing protein n=1 Tax=Actinomadura sp. DC4 TaxID=3055069 RepID=UPI0025B1C781|nr:cupin domain-containing protein [Actinomadura sp. DC4]MDN3355999.1 cupin domain-containing protein [Actinomadura sp. DC4]
MSYPEPRYDGDAGEISAVYRPAGTAPELRYTSGGSASYLATGASTNGQFGLYRWDMAAKPSGPSPHFHKTISESFFVLSGTVRLFNGDKWIDTTSGDFLYVPEGGIHAFRNESGEPASMLILFAPGAPREDYFETLADVGAGRRELTPEEWEEFYLRHDTYWT